MKRFHLYSTAVLSLYLFLTCAPLSAPETNQNDDPALPPLHYGTILLPEIFSDNMVIQQQTVVTIWGKTEVGRDVFLQPSWTDSVYKTKPDTNGLWKLPFSTPAAGGPYILNFNNNRKIITNVLVGEVWVCAGQSNMDVPMMGVPINPPLIIDGAESAIAQSFNENIRSFSLHRNCADSPAFSCPNASWQNASPQTTGSFSAVGYYFARSLYEKIRVPVAIIKCACSGSPIEAWLSADVCAAFNIPSNYMKGDIGASQCYYGMLSAIMGYGIKGFLWYQGETNHNEPAAYKQLLPAMVGQWRRSWGIGDIAFCFVQIAPYDYNDGGNSAYMRQAMAECMDVIPNSGVVISTDAGEKDNVHPTNKEIIGKRLAYWAMNRSYGFTEVACSGPIFNSISVNGNRITVFFKNADKGLTSKNDSSKLFEIAGNDGYFVPATAVIENSTVIAWSNEVPLPVRVRYAFQDWVLGDLYNVEGLPVSSFQTGLMN